MAYFVFIKEAETGRILKFGAYDVPPIIVAQDEKSFVIPTFSPAMLTDKDS